MSRQDLTVLNRPTRRRRVAVTVGLAALTLSSCGGSDETATGQSTIAPAVTVALPATCTKPPLSLRLEALTGTPAGGAAFRVTDAAARRVPIVVDEESGTDAASVARQTKKAKSTDLAAYTLYLADFPIERGELTGSGFGLIGPAPGGTIGAVSIAPSRVTGFEVGDVVTATAKPSYTTASSLLPLSVTVMSEQHTAPDAFADISGQVTVLHLSEDTICLDMSFEVRNGANTVAAVQGVVAAPVLRSGDSFFLR